MEDNAPSRDEELFTKLEKQKKKKRRRIIRTVIIIVVAVVIAVTCGVFILRRKVAKSFGSFGDVVSAQAELGSISTSVSGSGRLSNVDEEEITVPAGVEIDEVLVSANDKVSQGDVIATVDLTSVMSAMVSVQDEISDLDDDINDAKDDTVDSYITAGVAGTLKTVYAQKGDSVAEVMAEHGALALIELPNGEELKVTGIAGTVSSIYCNEGATVYASTYLFYLTDTSFSGNYDRLVRERGEKEEELLSLMKLYSTGELTAPFSGSVSSVDYDEDETDTSSEYSVVTLSPDEKMEVSISVDEANILSLEIGQSATITVSSIGDDSFSGELTEINKVATSSSGVTRYTAVITLDKAESMLPGMTAKVVIRIKGVDNAIIIPYDALHQTSSMSYVYTSYDEDTGEFGGLVEVETGLSNSSYVEISSGLSVGDTVYYTESSSSGFGGMSFGDMPEGGGDFGGGGMSGGGGMPSGGGGDFGGGGGGGMPGGGGGGMPGGF